MFGNLFKKKYFYCISILVLINSVQSFAQTCTGSLGDPIVNITFGAGDNFGAPLATGTTSSLQYQADICPVNGYYTILNYTSGCFATDVGWHTTSDHTGDPKGYFMLIDASWDPSNFYIQTIEGLCSGTTYEFAAWFLNMCSIKGILPNITFTIEKTDGTILSTYNTGDIPIINPVTWKQYGMFFTTPTGINSVVLRMRNNAPGGQGNDLGLDDITFRPAGPAIIASVAGNPNNNINTCVNNKETFQLTATVDDCYLNTAYQWQISINNGSTWVNIAGANSKAYTRAATSSGKYLYRLTAAEASNITIASCRVSSAEITINVIDAPLIKATNNGANCTGNKLILNVTGGNTYNWTGPNSFIATGSEVAFNKVNIEQAGTYYVTGYDNYGCLNTANSVINIYQTPVANFETNIPFCENADLNFTDKSTAFDRSLQKWSWNFGDGSTAITPSATHNYASTGSFIVSLTVTNEQGCSSTPFTKQLQVAPLPKADFILPAVCLTDPFATFINSSTIADNSQTQFSYLWNFADQNATLINPNSSTLASPQHSYNAVGNYLVKLTTTSNNGCSTTSTKTFSVNGSQPKSNFKIEGGSSFCSNAAITLTDQSTVDFGNITKVEIYWDSVNDPATKDSDLFPGYSKKYIHQYKAVGIPASKIMQIRYIVYSGINCINETTRPIEIRGNPVVQFTPVNSICAGADKFIITQGSELTGISGNGVYAGKGIDPVGLFNPASGTLGGNTLRYTFTSIGNCTAFAEQNIIVFAQPYANAGADRTMIRGGKITLQGSATGNNLQYLWLPDIAIDDNQIINPKVAPIQDVNYNLQVTSTDGCVSNDAVKVFVLKDIFIPTAFSPNGDGTNDTWHIPFLESYPNASIQVYNRYGEMVYNSNAKLNNWDGTFKGKKLPGGSYAWILNTGIGNKTLSGMVTILR